MYMSSNETYMIVTPAATDDEGAWGDTSVYYVPLTGNVSTWRARPLIETFDAGYTVNRVVHRNYVKYTLGVILIFAVRSGCRWRFLFPYQFERAEIQNCRYSIDQSWTGNVDDIGWGRSQKCLGLGSSYPWVKSSSPRPTFVSLTTLSIFRKYILLNYLENVASKLVLRSLIAGNTFSRNLAIEKGTVSTYTGKIGDSQLFFKFESYLVPNRIYKLDFATPVDELEVNDFVLSKKKKLSKFIRTISIFHSVRDCRRCGNWRIRSVVVCYQAGQIHQQRRHSSANVHLAQTGKHLRN